VDDAAEKLPPLVLDQVTALPDVLIALPLASASCAVIVTFAPAIGVLALEVTTYFAAVGAGVEMVIALGLPEMLVPPIFAVSDALPALAGAVYVAVQTPLVQLTVPSEPTSTAVATSLEAAEVMTFPLASLMVMVAVVVPFVSSDVEPTASVLVVALGAPSVVVMLPLVPVRLAPSVAVTVCTVAATVLVVNVTVAWPFTSVVLVALENEPPFVLDQVIVRPAVFTALFDASASCAVIVTVPPSVTELALEVTRYFDAAPAVIVSVAALPEMFVPPILAAMLALPVLDGAV